jgi:hypothetical protein
MQDVYCSFAIKRDITADGWELLGRIIRRTVTREMVASLIRSLWLLAGVRARRALLASCCLLLGWLKLLQLPGL